MVGIKSSRNTHSKRMSLEEARSVLWLRNNHRPLGELLDQGYLDERRLAWAAEKAYDPRLKEAASVLLDWIRRKPPAVAPSPSPSSDATSLPPVEASITLEQARATLWPFRPLNGQPMGDLADTRQLELKDLGYAIENAWDERVRQAAIVLTAVRLNQAVKDPAPPAGPLRVVSADRSFSERKQLAWTSVQGMFIGALGVLWIMAVIQVIKMATSRSSRLNLEELWSPAGIIALLILLAATAGGGWLASRLLDVAFTKMDRQIENYRQGQEGEDRVVDVMRQSLDGNWALFRNVTLPGRSRGDIDAVLVGPSGVWALEIKTLAGEYRNTGEHWEYRAGNRWTLLKRSPSRQAQNNAARLSSFLKADGIRQWVTAAVVWADPESPLSVEHPMVAVWTMDRLSEELGNIWQGRAISESDHSQIVEKLTALCHSRNQEEFD